MSLTPERYEYEKAWKAKNRERVRVLNRRWYEQNKEAQQARDKIRYSLPEYREKHRAKGKTEWFNPTPTYRKRKAFHCAKQRAKAYGREFTITFDEIVWPEVCPVLGIPLNYGKPKGRRYCGDTPSLDRHDSSKGYISGNVVVMSWRANFLKKDGSAEELALVAEYMRKTRSN